MTAKKKKTTIILICSISLSHLEGPSLNVSSKMKPTASDMSKATFEFI